MKSLGQYTLGDEYVSPQNRLSRLLMQQGSQGGPSHSWQETMGRIAQQLSGAYMGMQDQKQQDAYLDARGKTERDSFRSPTDAEAMATPGMRDLELSAMSGIAGDGQGQTVTSPLPDDQLMGRGDIPSIMEKIGRYNQNMGAPGASDDETLQQGLDLQSQKFSQAMNQSREASNVPRPRDFKAEMAQGMRDYQQDPNNRIMNDKMPQRDFMIKNLQAMPNNTYAKRGLAQALMQGMDQDREAGIAGLARSQQLEDTKNTQGFTSSENALNRGATLKAATLKASEPVNEIKEYLQLKQFGLFTGTFEEYKKSGKSETNVNVGGNAYEKENAGMLVGEHKIARESADNAYRQNMVIAAQRSIPLETGWGAQSKAWGAKFLGALGMANDEALQVANNADQFKSVTMSFLLDKLATQKGPQTEGDANRALETLASLQNMPDANRFILDLTETLNGHAIEKANFMDSYSMKNGNLIGYRSQWGASDQGKKSIFDSPTMAKWKGRDGTLALKPGQVVDTMPDPSTSKGVTLQGEDGSIFISDGVGWNRQ